MSDLKEKVGIFFHYICPIISIIGLWILLETNLF